MLNVKYPDVEKYTKEINDEFDKNKDIKQVDLKLKYIPKEY